MTATTLLGLAVVVMLTIEWRYRLRSVRVAAAAFAVLVLFFTQPNAHRAARQAIVMPPSQRITEFQEGGPSASEYQSGVLTMERAVIVDADIGSNTRLLAEGVLVWLACSPVLRRKRALAAADSLRRSSNE
jgi:hypothetical protein